MVTMCNTMFTPIPIHVVLQHANAIFESYSLAPLQSALRSTNLGEEQVAMQQMSESHTSDVSELTLSRYLSPQCMDVLHPNECLKAMTPRIFAAIARNESSSLVALFRDAVYPSDWSQWSIDEKGVVRDFFNSLWCERIRHSDAFGLELVVDAAPFGLATSGILDWWGSQSDSTSQLLVVELILGGMNQLQARSPYWSEGLCASCNEPVVEIGQAVTAWLLSQKVRTNLEALWLSESLSRDSDVRVAQAIEFLYSVSECLEK